MKKTNSKCTLIKIWSFILVICMMISILPGNLLALTDDSSASAETESAVTPTTEEKSLADEILEPIIVSEDITKRGENEKHFLCDDGSYIAVSYPQAVHEQVDGEWVDIEYDVTADGNGISPVDDTIKVKFANNTNSAKLVKLESGDYKISWTVEAENENGDITEKVKLSKDSKATVKTTKEITQENKEKIKNEAKYTKEEVKSLKKQTKEKIKKLELAKTANIEQNADVVSTNVIIEDHNREQIQSISFAQSNVEYVGAFGKGTTLRYIMSQGKINEEIVLESYNGFKSYSMVIDTDGLIPVETESGRVNLTDENGVAVVTIAAPYMYDAAEKHSYDVDVTVTQASKKEWRITYTPDLEWLTDKDRVYPIVIDPTVTTSNVTYTDIIDAYVHTGQTSSSNFNDHYLEFGYQNNIEYISYIRLLSLPSLPSGALLTGAGLVMKFTEDTDFIQNIGLYSVSGNIYNGNLTWNNRPSIAEFLDNQGSKPENLWITFCSKKFGSEINRFYKNGVTTQTYAIKFTSKVQGMTEFYSSDATNVSDRPYFTFRYTTEFYNVPEGKYYIRNVKSGLYLNVRNNATASGSQVTQKNYSGALPQIWEIDKAGTDSFYIIPQNAPNLKLYDPGSGSVTVSSTDYIRNQWRFSRVQGAIFNISTVNQPWVVLDVGGQSMDEGATIYPFAYHGYTNQQWELIPAKTIEATRGVDIGESATFSFLSFPEYYYHNSTVVWSSSDSSVARVDSYTGEITGVSRGKTIITARCRSIHTVVELHIHVGYPDIFSSLMNMGLLDYYDVHTTDDDFYYITSSLAEILEKAGILNIEDGSGKNYLISSLYDDWYLYCVSNEYNYGLYCMREQENDYVPNESDGDQPAVKISLVGFNASTLLNVLRDQTSSNKVQLYNSINYTTSSNGVEYNGVIQDYFSLTSSKGAYYIAEEYINFIATSSQSNEIDGSNELINIINVYNSENVSDLIEKGRAGRIIAALNSINEKAGRTIYNFNNNKISVVNRQNLSYYEKLAILTVFCANENYYSFAAEVQFHAEGLETFLLSNYPDYYNSCLRAAMAIDDVLKGKIIEDIKNGFFEEYWDLESDLVQEQKETHQGWIEGTA